MRERNTHTILSRVFLFLYSYERPRVKPKLVRKLSRRQQKQLNAKMEMNPSVFAVLIPQGHHLGCLHWGGGGLFAGFDNKKLGIRSNTALLMMNFTRTSEPSRHVQAALLTHTRTPLC